MLKRVLYLRIVRWSSSLRSRKSVLLPRQKGVSRSNQIPRHFYTDHWLDGGGSPGEVCGGKEKCLHHRGPVLFSGWTGIDISKIPLDQDITAADSKEAHKVRSMIDASTTTSPEVPRCTPSVFAEKASIGGLGTVAVGTPQQVVDEMER